MGTLAPPGEYDLTCASFGPPEFTLKQQIDQFSRFCTAQGMSSGTLAPTGEYD